MTETSATRQVADSVRGLRSQRRWSARKLAEECARAGSRSLTRGTIAKIESGVRKYVTADELTVLAQVLQVSPADLLGNQASVFVGRERELQPLSSLPSPTGALALRGAGSSGKSQLSRGPASALAPAMPVDAFAATHGSDDLADQITARVLAILDARDHHMEDPPTQPDPPDDDLVFVISSFTPEMEPVYLAIAAAAQAVGLRAERVKDVRGDYRITEKILAMISKARFIVADLSHDRPNVYFELGYARGLGKTVVPIQRVGTIEHSDVRDWTYIEYFDARPLEADLLERFKFEIRAAQRH